MGKVVLYWQKERIHCPGQGLTGASLYAALTCFSLVWGLKRTAD
jgi:hypothetical protein